MQKQLLAEQSQEMYGGFWTPHSELVSSRGQHSKAAEELGAWRVPRQICGVSKEVIIWESYLYRAFKPLDMLQTPSSALATMYLNTWLNIKSGRLLCRVPTEATREGSGCPICSGLSVFSCNSLAVKAPKTTAQWHPLRNGGKQPDQVAAFSMMTV